MLARIALCHDLALAGAQQPGHGRATEIDDEVPAPGRNCGIKRQPVHRPAPLFEDCEPLEPGHYLEQRRRHRARRYRQPRSRVTLDQIG